jgi:hypothetical protein
VQRHRPEQGDPGDPERAAMGQERVTDLPEPDGVVVEDLLAFEDLQRPIGVHQDERHHGDPGERHDDLLPDRAAPSVSMAPTYDFG